MNATNASRTFTVNGTTQSLIGAAPVTLSINPSVFANYTGSGTVVYTSAILAGDVDTGSGTTNINYSNLLSPTSLTLRYTYTPASPSPVPETGQVAASLLLLGGIGGYVFIKRRRKSNVAAA